MKQTLECDYDGALDTNINKARLIKELLFETALAKDPGIFQLAQGRDKKGILFGLYHLLDELIVAYDNLIQSEEVGAAGGEQ